jgi:(p)ppGpp synthase/HD superfamily hydrolase
MNLKNKPRLNNPLSEIEIMIYTQKIQKAIKFAAKTHNHYQQQTRKGKVIPYITHPLTVSIILLLAKAKEDVVVAGILHDTIEDSADNKKVTPAMIEERFGKSVKEIVLSVTEVNKNLPWAERKTTALEHIQHFSQDSVLVKSADVLSNGTELVDDYRKEGKEVFKRFKASISNTLANYARVISALLKRWPKSPLAKDLKLLAKELKDI